MTPSYIKIFFLMFFSTTVSHRTRRIILWCTAVLTSIRVSSDTAFSLFGKVACWYTDVPNCLISTLSNIITTPGSQSYRIREGSVEKRTPLAWQCAIHENKAPDFQKNFRFDQSQSTSLGFKEPIPSLEFLPRLSSLNKWGLLHTYFIFPGWVLFQGRA